MLKGLVTNYYSVCRKKKSADLSVPCADCLVPLPKLLFTIRTKDFKALVLHHVSLQRYITYIYT